MNEESIYTKFKRLMKQIGDIFAAAFRSLRPVIRAVSAFAKKAQHILVRHMTYSPDRKIAAAARVWIRTKNRRIKRKHWKTVFPAIMEEAEKQRLRYQQEGFIQSQALGIVAKAPVFE